MEYVAKTNKKIYFQSDFITLIIRLVLTVGCIVVAFFLDPLPKILLLVASGALIIHALINLFLTLPSLRVERPVVLREDEIEVVVKRKRITLARSEVNGIAFRRVSNSLDGGSVVVHLDGSKSHVVPFISDLNEVRVAAEKLGYRVSACA